MGALFTIVLVAFIVSQVGSNIILRCTYGSPAKDKDILELFEKKGDEYNRIKKNWDDKLSIENSRTNDLPRIEKNNKWFILYPYSIEGVGVVPRWYRSRKVIDSKFAELFKGSRYETNKRKKLGLE
jgi:hypothetical protein